MIALGMDRAISAERRAFWTSTNAPPWGFKISVNDQPADQESNNRS